MRTLVAISYSPWSEKARWALDHHLVAYEIREHVPLLGEPLLRLYSRKLRGNVSAPILIEDGRVTSDSLEIARRADELGRRAKLFPDGKLSEVRRWNDASERIMQAGRTSVLKKMLESTDAQREALPPFIPRKMRGVLLPMSKMGTRFVAQKYGTPTTPDAGAERKMIGALESLRAALQAADWKFIMEELTFADIAMAASLQFVRPVANRFILLGDATREVWTRADLASRFSDLLEWRDDVYERFRLSS